MTDLKYISHRSDICFGNESNQEYLKEGLGRNLSNRGKSVKKFHKDKNKRKGELKAFKK